MEAETEFAHYSPRATAAFDAGSNVFTVALPRSNNRPWITAQSEREAQIGAAKFCQRKGLRVLDAWFEDGEHPDHGLYRRWYVIAGKVH